MRSKVVFGVKRCGEFFSFDGFTATGSMDEFAVADVESDMGVAVRAARIKEYQVARFEAAVGNFAAGRRHVAGSTGKVDVKGVFVNELNHATAVEAGCGAASAPFVGCTDKAEAVEHEFLRALCAVDVADADGLDLPGRVSGSGFRFTVFAGGRAA